MRRALLPALLFATVAHTQSPPPALVAHRGASYDAPENTLASTALAFERGADAVEIDLRLAGDGTLVVIHDATTARTSNRDIRISDASWDDLKDLDVGSWKSDEYRGERVPRFEQVLDALPDEKQIFVDVKAGPEIAGPLSDAIDRAVTKGLVTQGQVIVIAFDSALIQELERLRPTIKTQWLCSFKRDVEGRWSPSVNQIVGTAQRIKCDGVDVNANLAVIDEDFVRTVRAAGLELHTWTVNDPNDAQRLAALGFDSITTDRPAYLRKGLSRPTLGDICELRLEFDRSFRDTSPNRLQLELPPQPSRMPGVFGMALDLRAEGGTVGVPLQLPASGTFTTWVRCDAWRNFQTIFDTSADANAWECWIDSTGRLSMRHRQGGAIVQHRFHPVADLGTWQHVAVTWNPEGLKLYIGGRLTSEDPTHGEIPAPGKKFHLGGGHPGNKIGELAFDDVAVFSRSLEPDEIEAVYRRGLAEVVGPVRDR